MIGAYRAVRAVGDSVAGEAMIQGGARRHGWTCAILSVRCPSDPETCWTASAEKTQDEVGKPVSSPVRPKAIRYISPAPEKGGRAFSFWGEILRPAASGLVNLPAIHSGAKGERGGVYRGLSAADVRALTLSDNSVTRV